MTTFGPKMPFSSVDHSLTVVAQKRSRARSDGPKPNFAPCF